MMEEFYNKHYIAIRQDGVIIDGWSDGPHPNRDTTTNAICINEQGGYQFRFYPGGEENPVLRGMDGIPLYKWDGSTVVKRTEDEIEADRAAMHPLDELRVAKKEEIGAACTAAIHAGVDVGEFHYSLTEHDQMELTAQYTLVKEGAPAVPYHADGELCRMYPADEFAALARVATAHVFYHRSNCNHVNAWIARAEAEQLDNITYGAELPGDLAASMAAILAAGVILNLWLGLGIWDYSEQWGNLLGQICPLYTALWCLLAGPVIVGFDWMDYWLCGGEKPRYQIL